MQDLVDRLWKIDAQIKDIYDDLNETWKDNGFVYSGQYEEYERYVEEIYIPDLKNESEMLAAQLLLSGFSDRDNLPSHVQYLFNRKDE